jgi:hypothetical protein
MQDDKPVTDRDAVRSANKIRIYCGEHKCYECVFGKSKDNRAYSCLLMDSFPNQPDHWRLENLPAKEAPNA